MTGFQPASARADAGPSPHRSGTLSRTSSAALGTIRSLSFSGAQVAGGLVDGAGDPQSQPEDLLPRDVQLADRARDEVFGGVQRAVRIVVDGDRHGPVPQQTYDGIGQNGAHVVEDDRSHGGAGRSGPADQLGPRQPEMLGEGLQYADPPQAVRVTADSVPGGIPRKTVPGYTRAGSSMRTLNSGHSTRGV